MADVDGERGRDRVAEAVGDRNSKRDAWTRAPVQRVRKQVRQERRQDVLHRGVLVDVADDTQRLELPDLVGTGNRSAEDDDARSMVELSNGLQKCDAVTLWKPQIEDDQVEAGAICTNLREEFLARLRGHGAVTGRFDGRLETIAHERGIVGDQHGSPGEPSLSGHRKFYR